MAKFKFTGECVVEAGSQEEAISQIANNLGIISRRLGNEQPLAEMSPFFALEELAAAEAENEGATDLKVNLPVIEHAPEPVEGEE